MATTFAKELQDEQHLGPHPKRAPSFGDPLDLSGIWRRAHAIRALHWETQLFVVRDVVDDAGSAKEDALREKRSDSAQPTDLRQGALDRKSPQSSSIERSIERRVGDPAKSHQSLRVQSTSGAQLAYHLWPGKRVERAAFDLDPIAVLQGQGGPCRPRLRDGPAVRENECVAASYGELKRVGRIKPSRFWSSRITVSRRPSAP